MFNHLVSQLPTNYDSARLLVYDWYSFLFRPFRSRITSFYLNGSLFINEPQHFFANGYVCHLLCVWYYFLDFSCYNAMRASNDYVQTAEGYYTDTTIKQTIATFLQQQQNNNTNQKDIQDTYSPNTNVIQWIGCDSQFFPVEYTIVWPKPAQFTHMPQSVYHSLVLEIMNSTTYFTMPIQTTIKKITNSLTAKHPDLIIRVEPNEDDEHNTVEFYLNVSTNDNYRMKPLSTDSIRSKARYIMTMLTSIIMSVWFMLITIYW